MVQIVAPEGWSPTAPETIGAASPGPTEITAPPLPASFQIPPTAPAETVPSDPVLASGIAVPPPPPADPTTGFDPLNPNWASPTEQAWRKLILGSAAGGLGLLAIGALIGYILTLRNDPPPVVPRPVAQTLAPTVEEEPEKETAEDGKQANRLPTATEVSPGQPPPGPASVEPPVSEKAPLPASELPEDTNPAPQDPVEPQSKPEDPPAEVSEEALKLAVESEEKSPAEPGSWVARRVPPSEEPAHTHDVAAKLAEKILRIDFREVPLARLLQFLSDLTNLPITLDLPGLASTEVTPRTPVSIQKEDTSVAEILSTVLSEQGLTYLTQDDQLLVTAPSASSSNPRSLRYPIDDLIGGAAGDADTLAELLQAMVEPGSWQAVGGPGSIEVEDEKLVIEQTPAIHQHLVTFCERLRVARGLPIRSRYSVDRFRLDTRYSRAATILKKQVAFTFHEPTSLAEVVRHLESETGAMIVVNWRSLAREKFTFATRIECSLKEQSLESALTAMLNPLGLAWQAVDERTLEILGRGDAQSQPIREFYPVAPLLAAGVHVEEIIDQVQQGTGASLWDESKGHGTLYFDPPSKYLVVRHGYRVQVQVQGLLGQLTDQLSDGSN